MTKKHQDTRQNLINFLKENRVDDNVVEEAAKLIIELDYKAYQRGYKAGRNDPTPSNY